MDGLEMDITKTPALDLVVGYLAKKLLLCTNPGLEMVAGGWTKFREMVKHALYVDVVWCSLFGFECLLHDVDVTTVG